MAFFGVEKAAAVSKDGVYRHYLSRVWDRDLPPALFIMLNPSTADDKKDDPTIRRCMGFARRWRCGGIIVVNLFDFRATDPLELKMQVTNPISSPHNDSFIHTYANYVWLAKGPVVAAWGVHGDLLGRDKEVLTRLKWDGMPVRCLGKTKDGFPRHPLYVPEFRALEPL